MSVKTHRRGAGQAPSHQKGKPRPEAVTIPQSWRLSRGQIWGAAVGAGLLAALLAYWPVLHGEFVFDDVHMQFYWPIADKLPFKAWLVGERPLTGFSYWINYQMGGTDTLGYHLTNLLLHVVAAIMTFLIVRKILELALVDPRRRTLIAGFSGALFLLHPVQTEAVAYISSRSENLSVALAFSAWAVFLYRPSSAIGLRSVLLVLLLSGAALGGKEHVAVLPLILLLTDYYWNPGFSFQGVRRNWRLYVPLAILGTVFAVFLFSYLSHEQTAGFRVKEFTWYQYLFTECRVLFIYLRLFLLPAGQNADYAIDVSRTPLEHGAIVGMVVLLAAAAAAIRWRKRFPIASFGFFVSLIFFLPTSSIMPIRDVAAERRLYLPMIGLLLILAELLVRLRWNERVMAGVMALVVICSGVMTWSRSRVWASSIALWSDTVEKSPQKSRPHLGLAAAEFSAHRSADAAVQYDLANRLYPRYDATFYSNWAAALEGAGRHEEAVRMGHKAVEMKPDAATYEALSRIMALGGDVPQALDLLDKGEKSDPAYVPLYIDRGDILMAVDRNREACAAFQKARSLDPQNLSAARGITALRCPGSN